MSLSINYSRSKINILYLRYSSFLFPSLTMVFVCQTDTLPAILERRVPSGFEEVVLIILSTINQPSFESGGFDESKRIILKVFLSDVCFIDRFFLVQMAFV